MVNLMLSDAIAIVTVRFGWLPNESRRIYDPDLTRNCVMRIIAAQVGNTYGVMLQHGMSCYVMLCYVMLCFDFIWYYVMMC